VAFAVSAGLGFGALFEPVFGVFALVAVGTGVVLALIGMNPVNPALRRVWALVRGIVVLIGSVVAFGVVGRACSETLFGSHNIFRCGLPASQYGPAMDLGKASPKCLESSFDHPYKDPAGRFSVTFPGKPDVLPPVLPGDGPTIDFYDVDNGTDYSLSVTTSGDGCQGSPGLPIRPAKRERDEMFMGHPSLYEFHGATRTSAEEAECREVFVGRTSYTLVVHSDPKDLGLVFDPQHLDPQQERVLSTAVHDDFDRFARSLRIRSAITNCGSPGDPGGAPTCLSSFEHPYSDPAGRFTVSFPVTPSPAGPSGGGCCDLTQVGVADPKSYSLYEVEAATYPSLNFPVSKRMLAADQKWMLNEPSCAGGPATIKRHETFRGHPSLYEFDGHSRTSSEETECRTVLVGRTTYRLSVTFDPQQTRVPSATLHINFSRFVGTLRTRSDRRR